MALPKLKIAVRPESQERLATLGRKLLREADAEGILPTPLERLFEIAKITNIAELPDQSSFLKTLTGGAKAAFTRAKQKIRGIADLRERATYVPRDSNFGRHRFVQAHELGHQTIPWHSLDPLYLDDSESLGPNAKGIFEHEANFFGAEIIFQGSAFRTRVREYSPSFEAIFTLSDEHGASKQATAWRYTEEQDEPIALLQYYPSNAIDEHGYSVLAIWRTIGSPSFLQRYSEIAPPLVLRTGDPWIAARESHRVCGGMDNLLVDGQSAPFQWFSWWNGRALLVLLRRKPRLSIVGGLLRPNS